MKLQHLYNQVIKFGKDKDPRPKSRIALYEDTAILYGDPASEVRKILVGIDIDPAELLLADRIREKEGLDLVIAHHPEGRAWAHFYEVMQLQVDVLAKLGVSRKLSQKLLDERMLEVERRVMPQNHTRSVDMARLLGVPFMCAHTPADNHVYGFVQKMMDKEKPKKVSDILEMLEAIPEYKKARRDNAGPRVILGNPNRPAGRIFVDMTGGTEGSRDVFDKIYKTGIRTIICMHLSDEHLKKVKDANLNVVIAGHISSDNLGLNLLLDRIEKEEKLETISCSGFCRIRR